MKSSVFIVSICVFFTSVCAAQDIHLSQYDANPLYINPALTGVGLNKNQWLRTNINYRDQQLNVLGYSNKTVVWGLDMPLNHKFAIGELLMNNTINNIYTNTNFMLSGSYNIANKNPRVKTSQNLIVGLQLGFVQRSFNLNNYSFNAQYSSLSSTGFDNNLPAGEYFKQQSRIDLDVNMGLFYQYAKDSAKANPFIGCAAYHLTQPSQTLSTTSTFSPAPMRFTVYGGCLFRLNKRSSILPQFLYQNEAQAQELNVGIMAFQKMNDSSNFETMMGIALRVDNAIIAQLGLKYKSSTFRVSYDMNTSVLKQYGNKGIEFSVIYFLNKKKSSLEKREVVDKNSGLE